MGKTILIVDDTDLNQELTSRFLQKHGYSTLLAGNGTEAIAETLSQNPDIILLDINLPDMDGWQVITLLKGSEQSKNIPIIVFTALDTSEHRDKADQIGCAAFITKPIDINALLHSISSVI